MKVFSLAACAVVLCLVQSAGAQEKPVPFEISYVEVGLIAIIVKDGKLNYTWHTSRKDRFFIEQNGKAYDRFQIDVWLSDKEQQRFRDWIARHKVFEFKEKYPPKSEIRTRGAADPTATARRLKACGMRWRH
jgi:hypothetical protein